ncbi:MAG: RIP metalloprotease RseP [Rhodobacter sp.]|nr:RIP metalloprotease RseP [Rhodobacter sp.]
MTMIDLIPQFGNVIYTIGAFIVALSVIVAVHEYGHYIVGRWCGIKADVFSLGFGPVLWSRPDKHGTVWQIAALPFGGYVKFMGDADAASTGTDDKFDGMDDETRRQTMHGAPLWARVATVAAGPVFNFILSMLIFGAILFFRGVAADPLTIDELRPVPGAAQTLQPGDEILSIAGRKTPLVEDLGDFIDDLPQEASMTYELRRDGQIIDVTASHPYPAYVSGLTPGSAAMEAGIEEGDFILSVDGEPVPTFQALREKIGASDGKTVLLAVWRDGEVTDVALKPRTMDLPRQDGSFETRYLIGITGGLLFSPKTETPGLYRVASYGVSQTIYIVRSSLSGLYHMAAGAISSCNLRGPLGIAQTSGEAASQGWTSFIWFIAVLSTAVGLLNLFPIPVLDGGHLVFFAYEAISGKPPNERALRILMSIGLAMLLTLMVFALTNDFICP